MNCKPASNKSNPKLNGLTLTEVLIALVITAIVAGAIYLTFQTVLGGYNKGKAQVTMAETARAAVTRLTDDLRNVSVSSTQPFLVSNDSTAGKKGDSIDNDNNGNTDCSDILVPFRTFFSMESTIFNSLPLVTITNGAMLSSSLAYDIP